MAKKPYKAKKVKLDKKHSMAAYGLTLIAAVAARTAQLQSNMNFATGKYIDQSPAKNYTLWALIIGFLLIAAVLILGKSKDKAIKSCILINPMRLRSERLSKKVSPAAAAFMIITAALIAFDIIMDLSDVASKNEAISTEENPVFAFAGVSVITWLSYVCAVITLITFISMASNILKGEGVTTGNCVFMMFFPIWKLLEIFSMFSENQLVGVYSEKVYIMLTAMASSMFFIYAARLFAGYEKKNTRICMCFFGYAASVLAAVSVVPRYISYFTLDYASREGMSSPDVSDVGLALVTLTVTAVFWSTYVYRVMPKLNLTGKRRWTKTAITVKKMQSIDEE
ncbi:MAG: hypothetical protein NC395_11270 [Prevotella sp.]|nr:hypothetical protein [Prevotella sp.]